MDFDMAARRLQSDQKSALAKSRASRNARTASAKAKREAQLARTKAERRLKERKLESERNAKIVNAMVRHVAKCERGLGVTSVASTKAATSAPASVAEKQSSLLFESNPLASGWTFTATSIHGEGDKIALPPSVLETMTSSSNDLDPWGSGRNGRPIAFRIGIMNKDYSFPSSDKMKALLENVALQITSSEKNALLHQSSSVMEDFSTINQGMDGSDDEADDSRIIEAYLDELSHRYLSYTHGTVVEFTQENDRVGLPEPIARALLHSNTHSLVGTNCLSGRPNTAIPVRRTVDPAPIVNDTAKASSEAEDDMEIDSSEKTPGHPAYGAFDVPALPIEITPINSLPPGKNCTFTPTASSVMNGFYALQNVKVVLEQSLMRTRATLSKGDVIRTWRRGVSFDLIVSGLSPAEYGVVSCINTNLNVDIGPAEGEADETTLASKQSSDQGSSDGAIPEPKSVSGGRLLSEPSSQSKAKESASTATIDPRKSIELSPEPPDNAIEGVCDIQIRGRTQSGITVAERRRFDIITATMGDLFAFASHVCDGAVPSSFRLVTRFPRRVFGISSSLQGAGKYGCVAPDATLESAGIGQGQELFMVESV